MPSGSPVFAPEACGPLRGGGLPVACPVRQRDPPGAGSAVAADRQGDIRHCSPGSRAGNAPARKKWPRRPCANRPGPGRPTPSRLLGGGSASCSPAAEETTRASAAAGLPLHARVESCARRCQPGRHEAALRDGEQVDKRTSPAGYGYLVRFNAGIPFCHRWALTVLCGGRFIHPVAARLEQRAMVRARQFHPGQKPWYRRRRRYMRR